MISTVAGQRSDCGFKSSNWWRYKDGAEAVETLQRDSRRFDANRFGRRYKSVEGRKTLITSKCSITSWPEEKCYDRIWVGVQGKESICVVTLKQDVDPTHAPFYQNMSSFAEAIISEVECIPYGNPGSFLHATERPFSVVSVPYVEGSDHEASSPNYDGGKAIGFLVDKMNSNFAFTFEETVETAIAAFQHLCSRELKAEDIWVSTTWNLEGGSVDMKLPERKEYVDIISGASSGEGRIPKVPPTRPGPPAGEPFGNKGLFVTNVAPVFNFLGAYNHLTYSGECPLSTRGGGCCSSSDDEDESGGLFMHRKKSTVPTAVGNVMM